MTTDELDALPAGTLLYLPTDWDVSPWQLAGRVPNRNFYTLLHPPDPDGVIANRRPIYVDGVQLLASALDERAAWQQVLTTLEERIVWIRKKQTVSIMNEHWHPYRRQTIAGYLGMIVGLLIWPLVWLKRKLIR